METVVSTMEELSVYLTVLTEFSIDDLVSVEEIANDRVASICEMYSDLMHPSCPDFYFYQ